MAGEQGWFGSRSSAGVRGLVVVGVLAWVTQLPGQAQQPVTAETTVAIGVPLHIAVTRTAKMRIGAPVEGILTAPVYVRDRLVLPVGAAVSGVVTALEPVPRGEHVQALLDGDVTPLRTAVVNFNQVELGTVSVQFASEARARQVETVRFVAETKTGLRAKLVGLVKDKVKMARGQAFAPGKKDRALRLLYSQLPYHPQRVWRGTDFTAELTQPAQLQLPEKPAVPQVDDAALLESLAANTVVQGRLVTPLNSDTSKRGDAVLAVVTQPVYGIVKPGQPKQLLLPEGAEIDGSVQRVKASRSLGRNGALRFTFRGVHRAGEDTEKVRGIVTGAQGSAQQNLQVDAEGEVKAEPGKNRFLAPFLLAATAAGGHDSDGGVGRQVVASNGLGIVARVVTLAVRDNNVASGFGAYGFAKSIYFRFLARGHAVTFPKDTLVEVQLSGR